MCDVLKEVLLMKNIKVAKETIEIIETGAYEVSDKKIVFNKEDHTSVVVYTPGDGETLLKKDISHLKRDKICTIKIINSDSYEAARDLDNPYVMNFANAHNPGGGFKLGANAQEEALCRCSTLYFAISESNTYNNFHKKHLSMLKGGKMDSTYNDEIGRAHV